MGKKKIIRTDTGKPRHSSEKVTEVEMPSIINWRGPFIINWRGPFIIDFLARYVKKGGKKKKKAVLVYSYYAIIDNRNKMFSQVIISFVCNIKMNI